MRRELDRSLPAGETSLPPNVCLRPIRRDELQAAAEIVYRSHAGSQDAALNLTYSTPTTCRAFVDTLVVRSGCGRFDPEASRLADGPWGPVGVLIASRLSRANGHVCQVSVAPEAQRGLGEPHGRRARAFREQAASATLSVTVGNTRAHRLYEPPGSAYEGVHGARVGAAAGPDRAARVRLLRSMGRGGASVSGLL
jgi:ribosomal protein S18 acetylase RimI-like enzyme